MTADDETEEDLRSKVVIPWLRDRGYSDAEVQVERTLECPVGRGKHTAPRCDILVKESSTNKNLFVIEVKRGSHMLAPDDAAQAISYARLVQPNMAPLTILTNGKDTLAFNTFTGDEISTEDIRSVTAKVNAGLGEAEFSIRQQGLRRLLGISKGALIGFLKSQIDYYLGMRGKGTARPPLLQEIFVSRTKVRAELTAHVMNSTCDIVVLVGGPGQGKTSEVLLFLQNILLNDGKLIAIPIYVPLALLGGNIDFVSFVSDDFGWVQGSSDHAPRIISDFDEIVYASDHFTSILWVLDDADLSPHEIDKLRSQLHLFLRRKRTLKSEHKLLIALQPITYQQLFDAGYEFRDMYTVCEVRLAKMTEEEGVQHIDNLCNYYQVTPELLIDYVSDPTLAHMSAQMLANGDVPQSNMLVRRYVQWRLRQLGGSESEPIFAVLRKLARCVLVNSVEDEKNLITSYFDMINTATRAGVLIRIEDANARATYRFRDELTLYWFLCYHEWELDRLAKEEMKTLIQEYAQNIVARRALAWFALMRDSNQVFIRDLVTEMAQSYFDTFVSFESSMGIVFDRPGDMLIALIAGNDPLTPWYGMVARELLGPHGKVAEKCCWLPDGFPAEDDEGFAMQNTDDFSVFNPGHINELVLRDIRKRLDSAKRWSMYPDRYEREPWEAWIPEGLPRGVYLSCSVTTHGIWTSLLKFVESGDNDGYQLLLEILKSAMKRYQSVVRMELNGLEDIFSPAE